jgi:hypothetical protein
MPRQTLLRKAVFNLTRCCNRIPASFAAILTQVLQLFAAIGVS